MGITKRRLEAHDADTNQELMLCAGCGERIEYEYDGLLSDCYEYNLTGPFTTLWLCIDCQPVKPKHCVRCERPCASRDIPVCDSCLAEYEHEISAARSEMRCSRCGTGIPRGEFDVYFRSDMCGWCEHMMTKEDRFDGSEWSPEKDLTEDSKRIIAPVEFLADTSKLSCDPRVIEYFLKHPEELYSIPPRDFEQFVAELLKKMGYITRLGPRGADGGVDVYAERDLDTGPELVLVQCKRYDLRRKVSQPTVKQLHADVYDRCASRGLFVTTSSFTKPAEAYIEEKKYRLAGADHEKLAQWLKQLRVRTEPSSPGYGVT